MINVTKTFLPSPAAYQAILERAWRTGWMTNRGILVLELEDALKRHLGVLNVIAMTNGTLALQIAIKALKLRGEIITTPFSYVATTSSIVWEGCTPVFVDIHPEHLTIDETRIEAAITPKTTAILATHVFGNPCALEVIGDIAKRYHLKVIYDAAHCFGVTYKGESVFNYGDVSVCSFHATKLFHTGEGGAIFTKDKALRDVLFYYHNFGHQGDEAFQGLGINAKMSEPQAAMGLAVLPFVPQLLEQRQQVVRRYDAVFKDRPLQTLSIRPETEWNFSYYPVIFEDEAQLLEAKSKLEADHINPRRYFYPSLNTLDYVVKTACPISESISSRILCLPLYHDLSTDDQDRIISLIESVL